MSDEVRHYDQRGLINRKNNCYICWFTSIFLLGILIFKGLTARRLYKSFGIKGLIDLKCNRSGERQNKHNRAAESKVYDFK
jgi:hypothetical protein